MKKEKALKADKNSGYSSTQVGTMLESLHQEIKVIAENHGDLDRRLERLEIEVSGNSDKMKLLEVTWRITNDTVSHLENAVSKLGKDLKAEIQDVRQELKSEIQGVRQDLKSEIQDVRKELKKEITDTKAELKADIHALGDRLTAVETR